MYDSEILDYIIGGSIILLLVIGIFLIAYLVLYLVSLWKLFKKAGKKGWESLIPYYSTYVLIEISGLNWWYFLIAVSGSIVTIIGLEEISWLTTIAGYAVNFFVFYNLGKKMHKSPISIGILGTLFGGIMIPILGLSKDFQYDNLVVVSPNGPIGDNNTNENTNNTEERFCLGCGQKLKPNSLFCENCGKKVD